MGYTLQDRCWSAPVAGNTKLVLMALASYAQDRDGARAFPTRAAVARMCGVSLRTVERALRELLDAGLIVVEVSRFTPKPTTADPYPPAREKYRIITAKLAVERTTETAKLAVESGTGSVNLAPVEPPFCRDETDSLAAPSIDPSINDPSRSDPSTHTGVCDGDWEDEDEAERERYFLEEELRLHGVVGAERYATPALAAKARHTLNVVLDTPGVESVPALFASLMARGGATETEAGAAKRAAARRERDPAADRFFSGHYGQYVE